MKLCTRTFSNHEYQGKIPFFYQGIFGSDLAHRNFILYEIQKHSVTCINNRRKKNLTTNLTVRWYVNFINYQRVFYEFEWIKLQMSRVFLSFYHESFKLNQIYLQLFQTNANNEPGLYHDVNVKDIR